MLYKKIKHILFYKAKIVPEPAVSLRGLGRNRCSLSLDLNAECDPAFNIPDGQAAPHVLLNDDF